jgi:hypothetical protein
MFVCPQAMAEAALPDEAADLGLDDQVPAPPSKDLVRQLQRAMRMSESEKVTGTLNGLFTQSDRYVLTLCRTACDVVRQKPDQS